MKRTIYVVIAALAAWSLILVGGAWAKPIEIKYWGIWTGEPYGKEIEGKVIERFNKLHEGKIQVIADPLAGGEDKLAIAVAGGSPPDVIKVDRFKVGSHASAGLLQPLDDLIKRDNIDISQFFPPTILEAKYKGKIYGLPWNTDDRAIYYNADLFSEVGLDPKAPPKTWEEMDAYSRKIDLVNPDRKWKRVGFVPHWGNWYFVGWLWAAGGDLLDETNTKVIWDQEPGVRAAEWMQSYIRQRGGWDIVWDKGYQHGALWGGALAMVVDGSWNLANMKLYAPDIKFDIAPVPRPKGLEKEPITWCGGFALSIPVGVPKERREAAWEFIKFYCAEEWAQTLLGAKSGQIPALRAGAFSSEFLSIHPLIKKFVSLMQYGKFRPVVPAGGELWSIYQDKLYSLLSQDKMPARQIVQETARLGQVELDKGWQRAKVK